MEQEPQYELSYIASGIGELVDDLKKHTPGRELSIVITHLETAYLWLNEYRGY